MKKLDLKQVPKDLKPNPVFDGMPEDLKNPDCFERIERRLAEIMSTGHRHKTVGAFVKCKPCNGARLKQQALRKELGFKSVAQYMEWRKVMTIIKEEKNFQIR